MGLYRLIMFICAYWVASLPFMEIWVSVEEKEPLPIFICVIEMHLESWVFTEINE